jgi:cytoskeletal protein CcmA (bactofilin family)
VTARDPRDIRTSPPAGRDAERSPSGTPAEGVGGGTGRLSIGQSIFIRGELTGNESLFIEGRVEGSIRVEGHGLTVGRNGQVKASIRAKSVTIDGKVEGNVVASERVEVSPSGSLTGDVAAPRIVISDGARYRGRVDMGQRSPAPLAPRATVAAAPEKPTDH